MSGVSLVNQFNTIFIYLFTALASGGAVVLSQYIGRKEQEQAGKSASQLLMSGTVFSLVTAVLVLIGNEGMLRLLFGRNRKRTQQRNHQNRGQKKSNFFHIIKHSFPEFTVSPSGSSGENKTPFRCGLNHRDIISDFWPEVKPSIPKTKRKKQKAVRTNRLSVYLNQIQ